MPVAHLPQGAQLYYTDSGEPSGPEYDTIVIVHGVAYNAAIFSPLNAAAPNNLRLIAYNQHGFYGSTPLSGNEIHLNGKPENLAIEYTTELVEFLGWLMSHLRIPRLPILLGWSKGTNLLMGLASPTFLPNEIRRIGVERVSAMIMFEPPGNAFGLVPTKDYTTAMMGEFPKDTSEEQKKAVTAQRFSSWISGFYQHQNIDNNAPVYGVDPVRFSADTLDKDLLAQALEPAMVPLGFFWALSKDARQRERYAREAIEQKDVPIAIAWNGETAGYIVSAVKAGAAMGAKVYKLDDKGNHLYFAHEPKKFLEGICKIVTDLIGEPVGYLKQ